MKCITLKNKYSTEVTLSSLGASILDIKTLDYKNELGSIVIVPKDKEKFYTSTSYFGKTIGRTGNLKWSQPISLILLISSSTINVAI